MNDEFTRILEHLEAALFLMRNEEMKDSVYVPAAIRSLERAVTYVQEWEDKLRGTGERI